jgi:ATP-dependent DNA ligase
MSARIERGRVQLLTRAGLDWSDKYPSVIAALKKVRASTAYLDGELCGIGDDGMPSFSQTQAATDGSRGGSPCLFRFRSPASRRLATQRVCRSSSARRSSSRYLIRKHAGQLGFEGVVSKTIDAPYAPGNRGLWRKSKCLNRQEFVVVGWTDPEGSRPHLGALLLGYYDKLIYAGRVGTGMPEKVLAHLRRRLDPLARASSPLSAPPPRKTRFGSPLVRSRVHWVEPQLVAEITYLTWTEDGLLRQTVYIRLRSDKAAAEVRREFLRKGVNGQMNRRRRPQVKRSANIELR